MVGEHQWYTVTITYGDPKGPHGKTAELVGIFESYAQASLFAGYLCSIYGMRSILIQELNFRGQSPCRFFYLHYEIPLAQREGVASDWEFAYAHEAAVVTWQRALEGTWHPGVIAGALHWTKEDWRNFDAMGLPTATCTLPADVADAGPSSEQPARPNE
jgi:hypothetical protein